MRVPGGPDAARPPSPVPAGEAAEGVAGGLVAEHARPGRAERREPAVAVALGDVVRERHVACRGGGDAVAGEPAHREPGDGDVPDVARDLAGLEVDVAAD